MLCPVKKDRRNLVKGGIISHKSFDCVIGINCMFFLGVNPWDHSSPCGSRTPIWHSVWLGSASVPAKCHL